MADSVVSKSSLGSHETNHRTTANAAGNLAGIAASSVEGNSISGGKKTTDEQVLIVDLLKLKYVHLRLTPSPLKRIFICTSNVTIINRNHFLEALEARLLQSQLLGEKREKVYITMKGSVHVECTARNSMQPFLLHYVLELYNFKI